MNVEHAKNQLSAGVPAIENLVAPVGAEQAAWKPAPHRWSIIEVICHLADEERHDFRARVDLLLHRPQDPFALFDPEGWVVEKRYGERDLESALADFREERARSLEWLGTLENPQWANAKPHSLLGELTAGTVMTSWLAHDLLHVRQLAGLRHAYLVMTMSPHSADYAGKW